MHRLADQPRARPQTRDIAWAVDMCQRLMMETAMRRLRSLSLTSLVVLKHLMQASYYIQITCQIVAKMSGITLLRCRHCAVASTSCSWLNKILGVLLRVAEQASEWIEDMLRRRRSMAPPNYPATKDQRWLTEPVHGCSCSNPNRGPESRQPEGVPCTRNSRAPSDRVHLLVSKDR